MENPTLDEILLPKINAQNYNPDANTTDDLPKIPSNLMSNSESTNHSDISSLLSQLSKNPDDLTRMMEESFSDMAPDMMKQVREMASGDQGDQLKRQMLMLGMDPKVMKSQLQNQKRAIRKTGVTKRAILICASRQLKVRDVSIDNIKDTASHLVNTDAPIELSCSRLAVGPLYGRTIKVWCNPDRKGKNKRASKIMGFPMAGELLIVMEDGDLNEKEFLEAENLID